MILSYLKIYFRSIKKSSLPSLLCITGLSVGITSAVFMLFYVQRELSFDSFHDHQKNIYRIVFGENDAEGSAFTAPILATTLTENYPQIKSVTFNNAGNARVNFKLDDKQYMESSFLFTDANVFDVFSFPLKEGNASSCLYNPFSVVISSKVAKKFFGSADPLGRSISMDWNGQWYELKITGLLHDIPENSHLQFDYLISMATAERIFQPQSFFTDWSANFCYAYLRIDDPSIKLQIERNITELYRNSSKGRIQSTTKLRLQPLSAIHLHSKLSGEISQNGDIKYIYIAGSLGILILLVSIINYSTILTALFTKRLKEIGVRKVLGAKNSSISQQFISESMINIILSLSVSIVFILLTTAFFSQLIGSTVNGYDIFLQPGSLAFLTFLFLFAFVSGIYPSLIINNQNTGDILYGKFRKIVTAGWVRNSFVVIQIFIALLIVIGAMVVRRQLWFIENKDLGFDKELMLTIPQGRSIRDKSEFVKNELLSTGQIVSSSLSSHLPSRGLSFKVPAIVEGGNPDGTNEPWPVAVVSVDYDFFRTYGLTTRQGRTFSASYPADSLQGFVINNAMVKALRWENPVGKEIQMTYNAGDGSVETRKGSVIGVIEDFHFESLHKPIEPIVFIFKPYWFYYLSIKTSEGEVSEIASRLKNKWEAIVPEVPFEFMYMKDRLDQLYANEKLWGTRVNVFSVIAICISCMGIFGLISFMVQNKMKEIAIRKVLGASSSGIALSLYKEIMVIIAIASLASIPLAWHFSMQWLEGFAYHIDLGIGLFASAIFMISVLSTSIILFQIIKASRENPIKILKIE